MPGSGCLGLGLMRLRDWPVMALLLAAACLVGCASGSGGTSPGPGKPASGIEPAHPLRAGLDPAADMDPFASTYKPLPSRPTAIVGATVMTGTGAVIENGVVLVRDGKVEKVAAGLAVPDGYES